MRGKKQNSCYEEDKALLLAFMDKAVQGDFSQIDTAAFHDTAMAEKYNRVLNAFLKSNNNFVMRLNDSMSRIGDSSCVKEMIEQVNSQTAAINEQVSVFREKAISINNIIDMVKKIASKSGMLALNASIEAARAGEAGRGFAVVANQIRDLSASTTASAEDVVRDVEELMRGITALSESIEETTTRLKNGNESVHKSIEDIGGTLVQLNFISDEIDNIYEEINTQSGLTQNFVSSIDRIADSYDTLADECVGTGEHLYRISRDIDRARSDMARHNANISTLDWLTVFEIDHLIFTWRLYNNLADFEQLNITQLNNPSGCKFGKWAAEQKDSGIAGSSEFRQAVGLHEELHKHACDSWHAKDRGDRESALAKFDQAYEVYGRFRKAMEGLRRVVRNTVDSEETNMKIYAM